MNSRLFIASLAAAFIFSPAFQSPALAALSPGACKQDEQKFCADAKPGMRRDCMKQHEADLSQSCKDHIAAAKEKMQEKMKEVKDACKEDLKQYCAAVTPGEGREMACLKSYSDKLSPACKEKLPKHRMHKGMREEPTAAQPPAAK